MSEKPVIKTICDSVNHTRFPKENHLPYWARRENKDTKGDRVDCVLLWLYLAEFFLEWEVFQTKGVEKMGKKI
jgi:hypothetical protein